ncbi:DNA replication protein DnaD [Bacillus sp. M6-12]|uniref:DnaD domain-containing protein n=1 Tax=Bacillus sp. M6-12 TaxID=2054166 RepID=UPI000C758A69|nr:DnaD domain-containing protein [Bacillus sp. M6-12]PLS16319.1 DNA replication protein DnaD [Bacillus sp. M6-12]
MIKTGLLEWMKEGHIMVPSFLLSHYKMLGLNESELMLLLQLQNFSEQGNKFPTPAEISARMTFSEAECLLFLQKLIQKGFIVIEEEITDSIRHESYSLEPMLVKIINCFLNEQNHKESEQVKQEEESLYTVFEQEFGRPLSPFECETLAMWMDDDAHQPEIIKAALKEAVISAKLNFRYIDRILFEWKKNGIKTIDQAKMQGEKFRAHQKRGRKPEPVVVKDVPFYNWLEQ